MTIGATKHDMRGLMHRLNAAMALHASRAFRIRRRLRLIDPILARTGRGRGDGEVWGERGRRTGAGLFLGEDNAGGEEKGEKKTSNAERPTSNVQWRRKKTPN